jgi:hypothetical protein
MAYQVNWTDRAHSVYHLFSMWPPHQPAVKWRRPANACLHLQAALICGCYTAKILWFNVGTLAVSANWRYADVVDTAFLLSTAAHALKSLVYLTMNQLRARTQKSDIDKCVFCVSNKLKPLVVNTFITTGWPKKNVTGRFFFTLMNPFKNRLAASKTSF